MKIVYILLVHVNYDQTMRLFNRLDQEDASFVIHISASKSDVNEPEYYDRIYNLLKDRDNCYFARRARVSWGGFGMVQGVFNAINTICENELDYDYAVFLSGQDYPIKTHAALCEKLEQNHGKQFMEIIPFSDVPVEYQERIETYHWWIQNNHFWYPRNSQKLISRIYNRLLSPFFARKQVFPNGYIPYKGSFWWNLSKDCIEYLYRYNHSKAGHNLVHFLKHTLHPSETYFQTVLMNSEYKERIINDDLRYVVFPENSGHPSILTAEHFEAIKDSTKYFARKLDTRVDPVIFDRIDKELLSL